VSADALLIRNARRLPAFGRELLNLRRKGLVPGRTVVVALDSWRWGRGYPQLVVPDELDPLEIDFCMIAGIEVFLAWSSAKTRIDRRDSLIRSLVACEPRFLWCCDMAAPEESFIVISRAHGLERPEYA
jgi:hypothetical protein